MSEQDRRDLLLDALTGIDDDLLALGLSLRESGSFQADTGEEASTKKGQVLKSPKPKAPRRKSGIRIAAAVAAACLLLAVLPLGILSVTQGNNKGAELFPWFSGSLSPSGPQNTNDAMDWYPNYVYPPISPAPDWEPDTDISYPEMNDPVEDAYVPQVRGVEWYTYAGTYSNIHKEGFLASGVQAIIEGSIQAKVNPMDAAISPTLHGLVEFAGQWYLSQVGLDYGAHFDLFQKEFVKQNFVARLDPERVGTSDTMDTYDIALLNVTRLAEKVLPYGEVTMKVQLQNFQMGSKEEIQAFQKLYADIFSQAGLSSGDVLGLYEITVAYTGTVHSRVNLQPFEATEILRIYQYADGQWYLAPEHMETDTELFAAPKYNTAYNPSTVRGVVEKSFGDVVQLQTGELIDTTRFFPTPAFKKGQFYEFTVFDMDLPVHITNENGTPVLHKLLTMEDCVLSEPVDDGGLDPHTP